jgi:hypothetical protein
MKVLRWVLVGLVLGAGAAFAAELVRPRGRVRGSSGYRPPAPARDHRASVPPDLVDLTDQAYRR